MFIKASVSDKAAKERHQTTVNKRLTGDDPACSGDRD